MFYRILYLVIANCLAYNIYAQDTVVNQSHLRVSLLTCGVGDDVAETFGHTGIRIIDSTKTGPISDVVYNYGTYPGFDKNFELDFMRGKLNYYVSVQTINDFMQEYLDYHRSVHEQVLLMTNEQKHSLSNALQDNALDENKYYKYDFFFDNCATRIRDMFSNTLGKDFVFGQALPKDARITFRDIINEYFYRKQWTRFGVNIILGSKIDKVMTNSDIMFLPDYLSIGVGKATMNGKKLSNEPVQLLDGSPHLPAGINGPFMVTLFILLLTFLGLSLKKLHILGIVMSKVLLIATGLIGCLVMVMWFATDHQGCSDNFNILWALPTNLIMAVAKPKGRGRYALIAIFFLFVTLLLHIFKIQGILLLELSPLLLALFFVYGKIYRSCRTNYLNHA